MESKMTAKFSVATSLDSYLEIQKNTHLKEKMEKPSPELISCFARLQQQKNSHFFPITFN